MKIEGGCHCGKIGYEADIDPEYVIVCHCADCQAISGAPYRASVPVRSERRATARAPGCGQGWMKGAGYRGRLIKLKGPSPRYYYNFL